MTSGMSVSTLRQVDTRLHMCTMLWAVSVEITYLETSARQDHVTSHVILAAVRYGAVHVFCWPWPWLLGAGLSKTVDP